jgi:hypothetical protein
LSVNNINVGTDYSLSYYDGNQGVIVDLGDVQNVKIVALKHEIKSMPFNNVPRYGFVPDGFRIDFSIVRTSNTLEALAVGFSRTFNQGVVINAGYLNETVNNPDGSVSRYQYTNVVVFLDDHGDISREKPIMLRLTAMASDKVTIA